MLFVVVLSLKRMVAKRPVQPVKALQVESKTENKRKISTGGASEFFIISINFHFLFNLSFSSFFSLIYSMKKRLSVKLVRLQLRQVRYILIIL